MKRRAEKKNLDVAVATNGYEVVMVMLKKDWDVLFSAAVEYDDSICVTTHDPHALLADTSVKP